jgi:transmembrane sensor
MTNIPPRAIEEAAAFRARQGSGPFRGKEEEDFQAWLQASSDHSRAWNHQTKLWARLDHVRESPAVAAMADAALIRLREHGRRRRFWKYASSLAASVVVVAIAWRAQISAPDVIRGTASSPLLTRDMLNLRKAPVVRDASTRVGERALIQLSDGSQVTLNTDSEIHVDLSGPVRSVALLRGEAYFDVAKDATHPFVVRAGSRQIVAVGTVFDVKLQTEMLKVDLVQGRVRVEHIVANHTEDSTAPNAATSILMGAGSSLVAPASGEERLEPLNVDREVGWRSGKLVFQDERVAVVVAEMNRYSNLKIEIRDPQVGERLLSGVFDPSGVAELARVLESYRLARIVAQDLSVIVLGTPDAGTEK